MPSPGSVHERSDFRMPVKIGVHVSSSILFFEEAAQILLLSCRGAMLMYVANLPFAHLGYLSGNNICIISFVLTMLYHQPKFTGKALKSTIVFLLAAIIYVLLERTLHDPSSSVTPLPGWILDPFKRLTRSYAYTILHYSLALSSMSSDAGTKKALWLGGAIKRFDETIARPRNAFIALVFDYARSWALWVPRNVTYLVDAYVPLVFMLVSVSLAALESAGNLEMSKPSAWLFEVGLLMLLGMPLLISVELDKNQYPQQPHNIHSFRYRNVKSGNIRLLLIYPRSSSEPIHCSLVEVSIRQPPRYEATSYTWGGEEKPGIVIIDGKMLRITQNAYDLLREFSSLCLPRLIWIDSICINQDDEAEKSEQIQLMTQIYQKAYRVTVWLGNNHRPTNNAQQSTAIAEAYLVADILTELSLDQQFSTDTNLSIYEKYRGQLLSERWQALRLFLCHPWFTRIWVVQEVALAREVRVLYCTVDIPWATLHSAIQFFYQNRLLIGTLQGITSSSTRDALPASLMGVELMESLRIKHCASGSYRFAELLMLCRSYQATNPRDKIYGILGISSHIPDGLEKPDYKATSTGVYETCARKLLAGPEFQYALSSACPGDFEIPNSLKMDAAPSWVADWSRSFTSSPLGAVLSSMAYHAGGEQYSVASPVRVGDQSITLPGCVVDNVGYLGPIITSLKNNDGSTKIGTIEMIDVWNVCRVSFRDIIQSLSTSSPPNANDPYPHIKEQHLFEACWRTLIGDRTIGQRPAPAIYNAYLSSWVRLCIGLLESTLKERKVPLSEAHPFWQAVGGTSLGRKMCMTDGRFIGLVPAYAMKGDIVFVARGVQAPLLLRKIDPPPGSRFRKESLWHYSLVGECYIHGIMDGVYGPDVDIEIF